MRPGSLDTGEGGGWQVGPQSASCWWAYSEADDPCWDQCTGAINAGVLGAGSALTSILVAQHGVYLVKFRVAISTSPVGGGIFIASIVRQGGGSEILDYLGTQETGGSDHCLCVARVRAGETLRLGLGPLPTVAASQTASLIAFKKLSR